MDAKRYPLAFGEQRPQRHHGALGGGVERGDLRRRILVERIESQALGGVALEQAGEGGRALLAVMQDANQECPSFGVACEPGRGLEDYRRCVVGVVEHEERGPVALTGLGDRREGSFCDLPAARVKNRRSGALDLGRELGHEPSLSDSGGAPDERVNDPSRARLLPAPA